MSAPSDPRPVSGASLRLVEPTDDGDPLGLPESERYEAGGLLGRGGMADVTVAHDRRLGRDVAVKTERPGDGDATGAALRREAELTARLEHPNIVAVHGAGRDDRGLAYYTMPVLRGRTLAEALAQAPDTAARLQLVRHFLDTCEAVAYANSQGVLHRDLKPANVMVGSFGETVVGDWGLACSAEEAARGGFGGGTPGYMSPEQMAGQPLDARSEVYSLGAMLFELISGERPGKDPGVDDLAARCPDAPPELAAIAARALSRDPADRYPDARALAEDVTAWFEGRRVVAYTYSPWELLRRAALAWRAPLAVGALALVAVAAVVAISFSNTLAERDRARLAELEAVAARELADQNLASALVAQAASAAARRDRPASEILAANALMLRETPEARGILARFGGRPALTSVRSVPLPACIHRSLSPDGLRMACVTEAGLELWALDEGPRSLGSLPGHVEDVGFVGLDEGVIALFHDGRVVTWRPGGEPVELMALDRAVGRFAPGRSTRVSALMASGTLFRFDNADPAGITDATCPDGGQIEIALVGPDDSTWVACTSRGLYRWRGVGQPFELVARLDEQDGTPTAFDLDPAGRELIVGTVRGRVLVVDVVDGGVRRLVDTGPQAVWRVLRRGPLLAVGTVDGSTQVWDLGADTLLGQIGSGRALLAFVGDGDRLRVVGRELVDWAIPTGARPDLLTSQAGVSSVSIAPDSSLIASTHGDGTVLVRRLDDGTVVADLRWQERVAKDLDFSPDGKWLAVAAATSPGFVVFDTETWTRRDILDGRASRRVRWSGDGRVTAAVYGEGLARWSPDGQVELARFDEEVVQLWDLAASPGGLRVVGIDPHGGLWELPASGGSDLAPLGEVRGASAVAPLAEGVLVTTEHELLELDASGGRRRVQVMPEYTVDLAVSPDERWLATGHLDGTVRIWRPDRPGEVAVLRGHGARVATVAFSSDGRWLASGSWDGSVRTWWLGDLETPAALLHERVTATWARDLASVLGEH